MHLHYWVFHYFKVSFLSLTRVIILWGYISDICNESRILVNDYYHSLLMYSTRESAIIAQ